MKLIQPTRRDLIKYGIGAAAFSKMAIAQSQQSQLLISQKIAAGGGFSKGFDFRAASGYVTDPANCTYVLADAYPTTRNGVTFGWEDSSDSRDRDNTVDARLAGMNFTFGAATRFRVDLPATGDYIITLALGDASFAHNEQQAVFKDNTTTLATIGPMVVAAGSFADATGVSQTAAAWPGSNLTITKTFASTIFRVVIGDGSNVSTIAHIAISQ